MNASPKKQIAQADPSAARRDPNGLNDADAWTVTVRVELPADGHLRMHHRTVDQISDYFSGFRPLVWDDPTQVVVAMGVTAPDAITVNAMVAPAVRKMTQVLGLPVSAAADIRTARVDTALDDRETPGQYVGVIEAAALLGVSKQRVAQLSQRPDFPEPLCRLRATPVWRGADIRHFDRHRRKPIRPN